MNYENFLKQDSTEHYAEWLGSSLEEYYVKSKGRYSFEPAEHLLCDYNVSDLLNNIYNELNDTSKESFRKAIPKVIENLSASPLLISAYIELFDFVDRQDLYNCIRAISKKLTNIEFILDTNDTNQNIYYYGLRTILRLIDGPLTANSKVRSEINKSINYSLQDICSSSIFEEKYINSSPKILLALCVLDESSTQEHIDKLGMFVYEYYDNLDEGTKSKIKYYNNYLKAIEETVGRDIFNTVIFPTSKKNITNKLIDFITNIIARIKNDTNQKEILDILKNSEEIGICIQ